MELRRGMRDRLEKYIDANRPIEVEMQISGASIYDFCCSGVDANYRLKRSLKKLLSSFLWQNP